LVTDGDSKSIVSWILSSVNMSNKGEVMNGMIDAARVDR
jgi:hypothetical protein